MTSFIQNNILLFIKKRKEIITQNRPIASDIANPKIAYVNSCCFNFGFRAYAIVKFPNTVPIPAPLPATPIVAAPAPISLAQNIRFWLFMIVVKVSVEW